MDKLENNLFQVYSGFISKCTSIIELDNIRDNYQMESPGSMTPPEVVCLEELYAERKQILNGKGHLPLKGGENNC